MGAQGARRRDDAADPHRHRPRDRQDARAAFSRSRASRSCSSTKVGALDKERQDRARHVQRRGNGRQGRDARVRHGARRGRTPSGHRQSQPAGRRSRRRRQAASSPSITSCARRFRNVFAIGDVTGQPLLAHRAMKQGVIAAEVITGDKIRRVRSGRGSELRLHRSGGRDRRPLRGRSQGERLRGAHRQVPARRERPRANDERDRRHHQARRRRARAICCSACTSSRRRPSR